MLYLIFLGMFGILASRFEEMRSLERGRATRCGAKRQEASLQVGTADVRKEDACSCPATSSLKGQATPTGPALNF